MKRKSNKPRQPKKRKEKQKLSLARSDDSGVALEFPNYSAILQVNKMEHFKDIPENMNLNNFRVSVDLSRLGRSVNRNDSNSTCYSDNGRLKSHDNDSASQIEERVSIKSQFSFEEADDQNLDYEPSECGLEDYVDSHDEKSSSPLVNPDLDPDSPINSELEAELLEEGLISEPFQVEQNNRQSADTLDKVDTILRKSPLTLVDSGVNIEEDPVNCNHQDEDDKGVEYEKDADEDTYSDNNSFHDNGEKDNEIQPIFGDNEINQSDDCDVQSETDLFKNATVNFKGLLNITITRPVINNVNNSELNQGKNSEIIMEEESLNSRKSCRWPIKDFKLDVLRITSGDDLFLYNIGKIKNVYETFVLRDNSDTFSRTDSESLSGFDSPAPSYYNMTNTRIPSWDAAQYRDTPSTGPSNCSTTHSEMRQTNRQREEQSYTETCYASSNGSRSEPTASLAPKDNNDDEISIFGQSTFLDTFSEFSENGMDNAEVCRTDKDEFITRWLMNSNEDITQLFDSLCEPYFTTGCDNNRCLKFHSLDEVKLSIQQLSVTKLCELYKMTLTHITWFTQFFDTFVECFKTSTEFGGIIDMISDVFEVFKGTFTDKTRFIVNITRALQSTGLSFKEAIENIILRHGTSQMWICDILLFIISKEPELEENWCLVKKIICCRKDKIDPEVVNNFLLSVLNKYPPNKELCKMMFIEIFERNLVDTDKIDPSLLATVHVAVKTCTNNNSYNEKRTEHGFDYIPNTQSTNLFISEFNRSLMRMEGTSSASFQSSDSASPPVTDDDIVERQSNNALKETSFTNGITELSLNDTYLVGSSHRYNFERSFHGGGDSQSLTKEDNITRNSLRVPIISEHYIDSNGLPVQSYCPQRRDENQHVFKTPTSLAPRRRRKEVNQRKSTASNTVQNNSKRSIYNNKVLEKITESMNVLSRCQTPANIVAHPRLQLVKSSRYECNLSLHNLCPEVHMSATEISTSDLLQLQNIIKEVDGLGFINLLKSYQNHFTIENFILNTLTLIKSCSSMANTLYGKFIALLDALKKKDPQFMKIPYVKIAIEVVAMNLIYLLETKAEWGLCRNILLRIKDWHNLLTSKIFFCKTHMMSHMQRYLYIINILIKAEDFHWVNEIFQLNELHLLEDSSKWPYQYVASDVKVRNKALKNFFEDGFALNIVAINDLLKHISVVLGGNVEGLDIWDLFNKKLIEMLENAENYSSILQLLCRDIINDYNRFLSNNVLQGYLFYVQNKIVEEEAFKLFKVCYNRGIYPRYSGQERVLMIRTTMTDFEIASMLECYFENVKNRRVYPQDFYIELKLPETDRPAELKILNERSNRSIYCVFVSVLNILKLKYNISVDQSVESRILITQSMHEHLIQWA